MYVTAGGMLRLLDRDRGASAMSGELIAAIVTVCFVLAALVPVLVRFRRAGTTRSASPPTPPTWARADRGRGAGCTPILYRGSERSPKWRSVANSPMNVTARSPMLTYIEQIPISMPRWRRWHLGEQVRPHGCPDRGSRNGRRLPEPALPRTSRGGEHRQARRRPGQAGPEAAEAGERGAEPPLRDFLRAQPGRDPAAPFLRPRHDRLAGGVDAHRLRARRRPPLLLRRRDPRSGRRARRPDLGEPNSPGASKPSSASDGPSSLPTPPQALPGPFRSESGSAFGHAQQSRHPTEDTLPPPQHDWQWRYPRAGRHPSGQPAVASQTPKRPIAPRLPGGEFPVVGAAEAKVRCRHRFASPPEWGDGRRMRNPVHHDFPFAAGL